MFMEKTAQTAKQLKFGTAANFKTFNEVLYLTLFFVQPSGVLIRMVPLSHSVVTRVVLVEELELAEAKEQWVGERKSRKKEVYDTIL